MLALLILACFATAFANNATEAPFNSKPSDNSTKEILKASETADPSKVEIVKQIRRLNDDGSYTIGYEADDGTFKIESRDVLGNVKGTFGYIDQDGEVKRVTYSSSSDSTPASVPVSTTTPITPTMVVKVNKTGSTTKPPPPTVVYPSRTAFSTKGTVIQPIPKRRISPKSTVIPNETTTEKFRPERTTTNILNLYRQGSDDLLKKSKSQMLKPFSASSKDDQITRQTTTRIPSTVKPVYENTNEKRDQSLNKANTFRRELTETSANPHMLSLRQSLGDDSSDVYGSHLSLGTVRPLFTTTTPRPRLVPIQSLVAARQQIQQHYQELPQEQETTVEASTGRVFDHESIITSTPVPVVHIPFQRENDDTLYQIQSRPHAAVHFLTREYLKDNPGAAIPIGNQRPYLQFDFQNKVLEPQFVKDTSPPSQIKATSTEAVTSQPYDIRPATRVISVPVDENGVPIQGYQARFTNPYRPQTPPQPLQTVNQRFEPLLEEMSSIQAPVSTRDLKRLLQVLIMRQNRLQYMMDQIIAPGPPYQTLPLFKQEPQYSQRYEMARQYEDERYDYRYDPRYRQELYSNHLSNYENSNYESQRFVPRRRLYTRPYDTAGSSSNHADEGPEYLPPDIREALLLKMLMLAISPDFVPTPVPPTELTTANPPRKQVRNIQILGEEGTTQMKRLRH